MKVQKDTIIRTIIFVIVIINMILKMCGKNPINIDDSTIAYWIENAIEIAVLIVSFWKNNSFSPQAIKADEFLSQLRNSNESVEGEG